MPHRPDAKKVTVCLMLASALLTCCAWPAASPRHGSEDVAFFRAAFEQLHPGLYRYASAAQVDAFFESVDQTLVPTSGPLDVFRALAPFLSVIQDGHTDIQLPEPVARRVTAEWRVLPLRTLVVGSRVWALGDASGTGHVPVGSEMLAINGEPIDGMLRRMIAIEPRDGDARSGPEHRLSAGFRFARTLALTAGEQASYTIEYRAPDGSKRSSVLPGATLQFLRSRAPAPSMSPAVEHRFEDDGRVAVLKVSTFGEMAVGEAIRTAFRDIAARKAEALVLDLRGNGGGYDTLGRELLAHLVDRPFEYYRGLFVTRPEQPHPRLREFLVKPAAREADGRWRLNSHANYGTHQPARGSFTGPVVMLMDGGSFSTTAEFLAKARDLRRGVFVGVESGGAFCGNTSGSTAAVQLPSSGIILHLPLIRYDMAVDCGVSRRGVMPDVEVRPTVEDRVAGTDSQFGRALAIARTSLRSRQPLLPQSPADERRVPLLGRR